LLFIDASPGTADDVDAAPLRNALGLDASRDRIPCPATMSRPEKLARQMQGGRDNNALLFNIAHAPNGGQLRCAARSPRGLAAAAKLRHPKKKGPAGPLFRTAIRAAYCVIGVKLTSGSHG
jgi:hypothetical protein